MTLAQVKTMLESISGFSNKVVYNSWPVGSAPALPFICFLATRYTPYGADGINYFGTQTIAIELYTKNKDATSELAIESKLTSQGLFYSKEQTYLYDEKCFETIYEIEV